MRCQYFKIVLLVLVFTFNVFARQDPSAEIVEIRTGFHHSYSRVVVEVFTRLRYDLVKDFEHNLIIVEMDARISPFQIGRIKIDARDEFLKSIEYDQSGERLKVLIYLNSMDIAIKSYELDWPYRIVIDISPAYFVAQNTSGETFVSTPAKSTRTVVNKPSSEVAPQNLFAHKTGREDSSLVALARPDSNSVASIQPDTTINLAQAFMPLNGAIFPDIKKHFIPEESPQPSSQFHLSGKMKRIFLIGAGLIGLNIIGAGVFLAVRRRRPSWPRKKRRTKPVSSIDVIPPEFKNLLQAALQADIKTTGEKDALNKGVSNHKTTHRQTILNDINEIAGTVEANNFAGSLSGVVGGEVTTARSPAIEDVEVIAAASGLTREELVGKDGLDFAKNLKLLSLN